MTTAKGIPVFISATGKTVTQLAKKENRNGQAFTDEQLAQRDQAIAREAFEAARLERETGGSVYGSDEIESFKTPTFEDFDDYALTKKWMILSDTEKCNLLNQASKKDGE